MKSYKGSFKGAVRAPLRDPTWDPFKQEPIMGSFKGATRAHFTYLSCILGELNANFWETKGHVSTPKP